MPGATPLSSFRVRPRFRVRVPLGLEAARSRLMESLVDLPDGLVVRNFPGLVGLHIADGQRHYWSPRLLLNFDPQPDGSTCIEGVYGPEIEIWSLFLYGYIFSGMIGMLSGIMGGAQLFIHSYPWSFWITGAMALMAVGLYVAAQFGQKMGSGHTMQLHQVWQSAATRVGVLPMAEK